MARPRPSLLCLALLAPLFALADAPTDRVGAGGYFRIMTRPDFEGGNGKLGYWNLYGRLLNEGPYGALELKLDALSAKPGTNDVWASVHAKLEGGSITNADAGNGGLANFRVSQLYVKAGNILFPDVTWQLGTLDTWFGDLGLYDMRPTTVFGDTVGLSARYRRGPLDVLLGVGDSGYALRGSRYDTVFTAGGTVKLSLSRYAELGAGGQYAYEPAVSGSRNAPYITPGATFEDYHRREVVKHWLEENPGRQELFPNPVSVDVACQSGMANAPDCAAQSFRAVGYLGFGGFGPIRWNNLFVSYRRLHPEGPYTESYQGRDYTIYVTNLTDKRYQLQVGDEIQLRLVPDRLDAAWAVLYGRDVNLANTVAAGDDNRTYLSTVLRLQLYLSRTVHFLVESSLAQEVSQNGNLYRSHADSIFQSSAGVPDTRGLEFGDSSTRNTWQLKGGLVFNPTGLGIYARPSLRLLYGLQYSSQQNAFGNAFVENLDQYNVFQSPERHWHSVVAIETEGWF